MSKCPKCKRETDALLFKTITHFEFSTKLHKQTGRYPKSNVFYCPICREVLFYSEYEAERFLKEGELI